jgi:hypothetical protein
MVFISDEVFDAGLDYADTNGDSLSICTTDPTGVYATVTGNQVAVEVVNTAAPVAGATDGRRVIVPPITAGSITATGTASHWALTDGTATVIASGALSATQVVATGNSFTLDAVSITIRDAA